MSDRALTALNIPWIFRMPPDTSLEQGVRSMVEAAGKAGPNRGRVRARQLIASHLIGQGLALVRRNAA